MTRPRPSRTTAGRAMVLAAALVAIVAIAAAWAREEALSTDQWVATSTQILADPEVQEATAAFLADQLASSPGTSAAISRALPAPLRGLAGPAAGLVGDAAERAALRGLRSGAFQATWRESNRLAHRQLITVVDGKTVAGVGVVLDLRPMVGLLAERVGLGPSAVAGLPRDRGVVRILGPDDIQSVQDGARLLRGVAWWSAALSLLLLVGGVAVARDRRSVLFTAGVSLALAGVLVLALRQLGGQALIGTLTGGGGSELAGLATWQIATRLLADLAQMVVVLGALLAGGAWLLGPGRVAVALHRRIAGPTDRYPAVAHAVMAGVVLWLVVQSALPWSTSIVPVVVYLVLGAALVEAVRRRRGTSGPSAAEAGGDVVDGTA